MSTRTRLAATLVLGILLGAITPLLLGAGKGEKENALPGQYDARMNFVAGGFGGLLMQITDRTENKLYVYHSSGKGEKKGQEGEFRLVCEVDLTSVGETQIQAKVYPKEEKKTPEVK